jgi:hypothetical protein
MKSRKSQDPRELEKVVSGLIEKVKAIRESVRELIELVGGR